MSNDGTTHFQDIDGALSVCGDGSGGTEEARGAGRIVDAVKARGYLQGAPADELGRQVLKLIEETREVMNLFRAPDKPGLARGAAHELFDNMGEAGYWAAMLFRDGATLEWDEGLLSQVRAELADVEVVIQCAWALCDVIDGKSYPLVAAALDKARGDIERGVTP